MFCQNCGKEVEEGDRFCKNCGVLIGYTREEGTPVLEQGTPEQTGQQGQVTPDAQGQPDGQEQPTGWGQVSGQEQTGNEESMRQQFVSFHQEEPQPSSSGKMMTWIIVGAVSFLGLISMIILFVLFGAARKNAEPKLQEFREQMEESQDYYDDDYNDYDYDDYDYNDDYDSFYDDGDDSHFYDDEKPGGEHFF